MELTDLLDPDSVICNLRAASKKLVLQDLARRAAEVTGLSERAVFDTLLEREKLGSTAVGHGIAIPHGKLAGLDRLYGLVAKLEHPIEFDAADDQPVDLVFLLLAPEASGADHLKALAKVSRLLRDEAVCEHLRQAGDPTIMYQMVVAPQPTLQS
jgi:nitrogen PTS system EIIA component